MLKKKITLSLLIISLAAVSNLSIVAQTRSSDENQMVSKPSESKPETLRDVVLKTKEAKPASDREVMAAMDAIDKQNRKASAKKLSTSSKVMIGVGIAAAVVIVVVLATYLNNER